MDTDVAVPVNDTVPVDTGDVAVPDVDCTDDS